MPIVVDRDERGTGRSRFDPGLPLQFLKHESNNFQKIRLLILFFVFRHGTDSHVREHLPFAVQFAPHGDVLACVPLCFIAEVI